MDRDSWLDGIEGDLCSGNTEQIVELVATAKAVARVTSKKLSSVNKEKTQYDMEDIHD